MDTDLQEVTFGITHSQEPKYGVNKDGRLFNRATGEAIPDTEPVFVLRAKDLRALPLLVGYLETVPEGSTTHAAIVSVIERFRAFSRAFPHLMKSGDSKAPPPPVPHSIAQAPRTLERPARAPWPFPTSSRT